MSSKLYIKTTKGDILNQLKPRENGYHLRTRTNNIRLACWAAAWLAAAALMAFGPRFLWDQASVFTLLAIGLDLAVGVGLILACKNYVMELDELQQKIYLNALGITVGVAVVGSVPYSVMGRYHVIPFHAEISDLLILMSLTFALSIVYGSVRYR